MKNQFKFKLEGLLSLRKFKEKKIKGELSFIVAKIENIKGEISNIYQSMNDAKDIESDLVQGKEYDQYFSFFNVQRNQIKQLEATMYSLDKKYHRKAQELSEAKGEVKIIDNMKQKAFKEHKKEIEKKSEEQRSELIMMRNQFKKSRVL